MRKEIVRIWQAEWGLSAMLVFLVLALFVGAPLVATNVVGMFFFEILFSLLLVSGVFAISHRPVLRVGVSVLTVLTLGVRWASYWKPSTMIGVLVEVSSMMSVSVLIALVLFQVFREGPITSYRIQGAIVVYLLLGLAWTSAYELVYRIIPTAFSFANAGLAEPQVSHGLVYFSFVTLTTVGYGDITAAHPISRSLAIAEALVGQLYPAILIARLVSLEIASRQRK